MTEPVLTVKTGTNPALADTGRQITMQQVAPYPYPLADLIDHLTYRPGWRVWMDHMDRGQGSEGLTLVIEAQVPDSRRVGHGTIYVHHLFPVPPAAYNTRSWQRWLFDRYCEVERHEAAEFFQVGDRRPYAPLHAPGNDPYMVIEATRDEEHTDNQGRVSTTRQDDRDAHGLQRWPRSEAHNDSTPSVT